MRKKATNRKTPGKKTSPALTHLDDRGRAHMVDVGGKEESSRLARASAAVIMSRATLELVARSSAGSSPLHGKHKGDVIAVARLAGISALKRASDWIPLCHPVRLVGSEVEITLDRKLPGVRINVTAHAFDRTGVEMEALVGASAAALTVYDMVKGTERGVRITDIQLEEKSGGRSGIWRRGS